MWATQIHTFPLKRHTIWIDQREEQREKRWEKEAFRFGYPISSWILCTVKKDAISSASHHYQHFSENAKKWICTHFLSHHFLAEPLYFSIEFSWLEPGFYSELERMVLEGKSRKAKIAHYYVTTCCQSYNIKNNCLAQSDTWASLEHSIFPALCSKIGSQQNIGTRSAFVSYTSHSVTK